jgi:hypothetical protein
MYRHAIDALVADRCYVPHARCEILLDVIRTDSRLDCMLDHRYIVYNPEQENLIAMSGCRKSPRCCSWSSFAQILATPCHLYQSSLAYLAPA